MRSMFQVKDARGVWIVLPLIAAALLLSLAGGRAAGATAADPNDPNAAANSVDVGTFNVSGGTPGSWIQAALARHQAFVAARVNAARNGEQPGVQWSNSTTAATSTSTGSSSSSLDSLSSLLSQTGSSSSTLDSLSSLLGSLTGTSASTSTSTTASKSSATQQNASDTTTTDSTSATGSSADAATSFRTQLASSLLDTLFSALTLDFQSTDFVNFLKALLEPLLLPPASDQTNNASAAGG